MVVNGYNWRTRSELVLRTTLLNRCVTKRKDINTEIMFVMLLYDLVLCSLIVCTDMLFMSNVNEYVLVILIAACHL